MADIYEPEPTPSHDMQSDIEKKPFFTILLTALVGFAALVVGWLFLVVSNLSPSFSVAAFLLFIGLANTSLGLLDIYVAYSLWNMKYETKYFGMIANVGLVVLNLFSFNIGFVGIVLVIASLIMLLLLDPSQS